LSAGDGNAGGVSIRADSVNLRNGGGIISTTSGAGTGGQVLITARELIVDGSQTNAVTGITAGSLGTAINSGGAGRISINVDSLILRKGFISSSTNGPGRGGDVSIAAHSIALDQTGSITTETGVIGSQGTPTTFGAGGAIKVDTTSMQLLSGGRVSASTYANGLGGTVTVNAGQLIIDSTGNALAAGITANTGSNTIATATGAGGNLFLHVDDLQLRNQGQIGSNAFGSGQAGRIEISGSKMSIAGGAVVSASSFGQAANAGGANDIVIQTGDLSVADFGQISNSTTGVGAAGRLLITSKSLTISNGGLLQASSLNSGAKAGTVGDIFISSDVVAMRAGSIDARSFGSAAPGAIVINARTATLDDGAVISATSAGSGSAGSISIGVADTLKLSHSSRITTEALRGSGGNIQAFAGNTMMLSDSAISTSVLGAAANGGNISIDPVFVILNRSQIVARAVGGSGGNIGLTTQYLIKSADSDIDASSQLGISGHVEIFGADVNLNADIAALPTEFLNAKRWLAKSCASRLGGDVSQFTVNGRDGVYRSPFDLSASPTALDSSSSGSIPSASVSGSNVPRMSFSPECLQGPG
jgi:large exoprotein involved in heme utilization and adhesion